MNMKVKSLVMLVVFAACFAGGVWVERNYLSSSATEARNREVVLRYVDEFLNRHNPDVLDELMAADWIAHNPGQGNGRKTLQELAGGMFEQFPEFHADVKRVFTDGDFVITHTHHTLRAQDRGRDWAPGSGAGVDIFHLKDGKIVEHWDVLQNPIPEESVNGNSMFDGGGVYNYR